MAPTIAPTVAPGTGVLLFEPEFESEIEVGDEVRVVAVLAVVADVDVDILDGGKPCVAWIPNVRTSYHLPPAIHQRTQGEHSANVRHNLLSRT